LWGEEKKITPPARQVLRKSPKTASGKKRGKGSTFSSFALFVLVGGRRRSLSSGALGKGRRERKSENLGDKEGGGGKKGR